MDQIYCTLFLIHIPISFLTSYGQLWPKHWLASTVQFHFDISRDPLTYGAMFGGPEWDWYRTLLWAELLCKPAVHVLGIWGLWNDDKRIYPVLLGWSTANLAVMVPIMNALYTTPTIPPLNKGEFTYLLSCYGPWVFFPVLIAVDMGGRLFSMANKANAEEKAKLKAE